jgi:short-subunit dehydrogenase
MIPVSQNFEVDHLVNNAGFADWTGFLDADWHRQHEIMQLNGAFHA